MYYGYFVDKIARVRGVGGGGEVRFLYVIVW